MGSSVVRFSFSCLFISRMYVGFQMSLGLLLLSMVRCHDPMLLILNLGFSSMHYIYISVLEVN